MSVQISPTLSIPVDSKFRKTLREIPLNARWTITGNLIKVASNADITDLSSLEKSAFAILYAATWRVIDFELRDMNLYYFTKPSGRFEIDRLNENTDVFLVYNTANYYLQGYAYTERHEEPVTITLKKIAQGINAFSMDDSKSINPSEVVNNAIPNSSYQPSSAIAKKESTVGSYKQYVEESRLAQLVQPRLPNKFDYPEPVIPPQPPKFAADSNHPYPSYQYARKL